MSSATPRKTRRKNAPAQRRPAAAPTKHERAATAPAKAAKSTRKKAAAQRRERHAALTRQVILAAAASAFTERGYRGATVQDIAARAGYTAASLYTYFRSKAEIFAALVETVLEDTARVFAEPPVARATFADSLEALTRALLGVTERHQQAVVYFLQLQDQGGSRPASARGPSPDMVADLEAWFGRHVSPGDLPELTTREAAVLYWSLMSGIVRVWAHDGGARSLLGEAPRLTRFFLHGVGASTPNESSGAPRRRSSRR